MKPVLLIIAMCSAFGVLAAQNTEDWVESAQDPEELQAWLDELRREPLDLNSAPEEKILLLPFMDASTVRTLADQRRVLGGFRDMEEALGLSALSEEQRGSLREFACIRAIHRPTAVQSRIVAGTADATANAMRSGAYWGRSQVNFKSSAGRTGFADVRRRADDPSLFDQTSAGLEIAQDGNLPDLTIGDFQYEAGTGLVFASAYGMANWLTAPGAARVGQAKWLALRPSSDRRSVYRGVALHEVYAPIEFVAIGSWNRIDGSIFDGQADQITEGQSGSNALDRSRRDQIEERLYGLALRGGTKWWHAGVHGYQTHFSPSFFPSASDQSIPRFSGSVLRTGSLFAAVDYGGLEAIAEAAGSSPGGHAFQGAISARSAHGGLTLYHMSADADFYSPHSKLWGGFGATASNRQSTGIRISAMWSRHSLSLSASSDQTPFRTATAPLGATGNELEIRWTTFIAAPVDFELLGRRTVRDETSSSLPARNVQAERGRVEVRWRAHEEYRIRFEVRTTDTEGDPSHHLSSLLFLQTTTRLYSTNVTGRLTFFGLEDEGNGPVQVYESSLPGAYPLVPLSGSGRRFAVTVSRAWKHVSADAKIAQTVHQANGGGASVVDLAVGVSYQQ